MTQIPAGWYPDPDTSHPEAARGQRYWDGQQWTEHVHPAPGAYQAEAPGYGGPTDAMPSYAPAMPAGPAVPARATTPDGQPLAGWWHRVGAYVVDFVITSVIASAIGFRWVSDIVTVYGDLFTEAMRAAQDGGSLPDQSGYLSRVAEAALWLSVIRLAVGFVYHVGFLKWRAATPGKLLLGLRVRLREVAGPMSWRTVLLRWLGQFWHNAVAFVPVLGSVASIWPVVDVLWPLWDDKKQALHDKVARTNVVRVR